MVLRVYLNPLLTLMCVASCSWVFGRFCALFYIMEERKAHSFIVDVELMALVVAIMEPTSYAIHRILETREYPEIKKD
ncbi:hypothetical protein DICVIV_00069 [Dictyocaulus viviparus]|uniref:Uncharacterized protein n=1 Tax=Dictyocaulus viviparus TaxID=29172 RepID=A0A0D8YG31_DICVI|nr:hypothetical protein DICVIV_00069 [Dictyocaulus viviparus]